MGIGNHGRPWACEREGPVPKKMLWKMGTCSRLSERLIRDGRDSAKRVVSDTHTPGCTEGTVPILILINSFNLSNTLDLLEFLDQPVK